MKAHTYFGNSVLPRINWFSINEIYPEAEDIQYCVQGE